MELPEILTRMRSHRLVALHGHRHCVFGAILRLAVTFAMYGPNQSARARHIFRQILVWYRASRVQAHRLKALPLTRLKPKNANATPQLKASTGPVRTLVPFLLVLARSLEEQSQMFEESRPFFVAVLRMFVFEPAPAIDRLPRGERGIRPSCLAKGSEVHCDPEASPWSFSWS